MKFIKTVVRNAAAAVLLAASSAGAFAQIPVTDLLGLAQEIQQVASWVQQYQQMADQLKSQKEQLDAVTGSRGMSQLAGNMARQQLPSDFAGSYDQLRTQGAAGASSAAKTVYNGIKRYDCSEKFPTDQRARISCESSAMAAPENISLLNTVVSAAQKRQTELKQLQSSVDTTDAKAAADLANRLSVEIAYLQNEKLMLDMALQQREQQLALTRQQQAEEGAKRLTRSSGGGSNPFNLN